MKIVIKILIIIKIKSKIINIYNYKSFNALNNNRKKNLFRSEVRSCQSALFPHSR